ncbi:GlxA family transcriptional regulator [Rhodopseudomonas sp. HC1]|uniref:GlxA family transcriptional regulator n=1 Tax=Rhodopseudomonas infernalis TaxID=2897386 RepID=UPI001EE7B229|nr:GlxA family transcriptional regulator [Rhodopseudomonas infernalis]MCG6203495.1 GlxA family transcriptional regulator [Rhodopseudomonas infernalis]
MIGVLIYPGFQLLDAAGPIAAFEIAGRYVAAPEPVRILSAVPGPVRSSSGVEMMARGLRHDRGMRTLMIAGGDGVRDAARCPRTLAFLRAAAARGCRIASVCSGAYLLAEAGLLDGRRATTHWGRTRDFLKRYPQVRLEPDRIFVRDGDVWTSAGITAGIDLALAIIADETSDAVARDTARQLVLAQRRSGGQSQFSSLLELQTPSGRFATLLSWVREHLDEHLTVERLADQAGMSARHFSRAFIAETGATPAKAVERLRLEAARTRVQTTGEAIERVAEATGFGDTERMRRAFLRAFGQPPQAVRRAARAA